MTEQSTHTQKRLITEYFASSKSNQPGLVRKSGFPTLPDDVQGKLLSVGRNARKAVSDGYKYSGTSIPSYKGLTIGPTNPGAFEFTNIDGSITSSIGSGSFDTGKSASFRPHSQIEKRTRSFEEENDYDMDGGDTDIEDDIKVSIANRPKAQIRARRSASQKVYKKTSGVSNVSDSLMVDDFEDADFLVPKENIED